MSEARVSERVAATGPVGEFLSRLLDPDWASRVSRLPYSEQISAVYQPTYGGKRVSELARGAAAFLVPDFPVQVYISEGSLRILLYEVLGMTLDARRSRPSTASAAAWGTSVKKTVEFFPLKRHPAAQNKVNVYLNEVLSDLREIDPMGYLAATAALLSRRGKLSNDQASAVVLYGYGLASCGLSDSFEVAARLAEDPELCKNLTTFIKAVGANGSALGAALVEANALQGRGVGILDLEQEARYRTTDACLGKVVHFDDDLLRAECRRLLETEIAHGPDGTRIDFPSLADHWDRRWEWAVNGAHSGHVSRLYPRFPKPPGMLREHRRAWLEAVEEDPRPTWDGHTFVSASPKLECGKTRAIFACDTVNYLSFEHLMGPVERRWRNRRVVLDPGKGGHVGMVFRTQAAKARAGVSMMLDYDDFNSQHSTRSMQILIEELVAVTGYPQELGRRLVESFDKSDIWLGNKFIGRARGTLMSGHRCTTFINTCLNYVYLRLVLGSEVMDDVPSVHVGDDVYLGARTYRQAGDICERLRASALRMNPVKQSVGHVSTEFLRCCASGRSARGYFARAVGSVVAGNWVSDLTLSPSEALASIVGAARTLSNRSQSARLPLLLFSSVVRMTALPKEDHKKLRELLTGVTALDNGPQFHPGGYYRSVPALVRVAVTDRHGYAPLPGAASRAFLTRAAAPLEIDVLTQAGVTVVEAMEEASFRKSLPARYSRYETVRLGPLQLTTAIGSASIADLVNTPPQRGVLSRFPLLTLARKRLPEHLVRWAVKQVGGNPLAADLEYEAWGEFKHGCIVGAPMSYTDAAMFGHRTLCSVLTSPVSVYM